MHHHIPRICRIRKHTIRLNNLLREPIIQSLQQKTSQPGARSTSNRMQHHETLEGVGSVGFAVNHLHDVFVHRLAGLVAVAPIVSGADAVLSNEEVFGVVDVFVGAGLNAVDDLLLFVSLYPRYRLAHGCCARPQCVQASLPSMPHLWSERGKGAHTLGSKSIKIALGIYLVSSLW